jgi:phosphodiesterase/alkaline phosphatase D-like protein
LYAEVQRFFVTKWDDRGIEANWTNGNANGEGEEEQAWVLKKSMIGMYSWLRLSLPSSFSSHLS